MDSTEFGKLFEQFERTAFRLQVRDEYSVSVEDSDLRAYLSGEPFADRANNPWLQYLRTKTAEGRRLENVNLMPEKFMAYTRYTLDWWSPYLAEAGHNVKFLLPTAPESVRSVAVEDFWMFDESTVVRMNYDKSGKFLGPELVDKSLVGEYVRIRAVVMEASVDLRTVLSLWRAGGIG